MPLFLFSYTNFCFIYFYFDCKFITHFVMMSTRSSDFLVMKPKGKNSCRKNMRACVNVGACANVIWTWSGTDGETKILPSSRNTAAYIETNGICPVLHIERYRSILGELITKIILILSENKPVFKPPRICLFPDYLVTPTKPTHFPNVNAALYYMSTHVTVS